MHISLQPFYLTCYALMEFAFAGFGFLLHIAHGSITNSHGMSTDTQVTALRFPLA